MNDQSFEILVESKSSSLPFFSCLPLSVLSFVPIWGGAEIWWIGLAISSHGAERKKGAIPTAESVSPALLYLDLEREEFSWVTEDRSSWVGEGG